MSKRSHVLGVRMATILKVFVVLGAWLTSAAAFAAVTPSPKIQPRAAQQIKTLTGIKQARSPMQNKIDSRLYLGLLKQQNDPRLEGLTNFRFVKPDPDGRIAVDIILAHRGAAKAVVAKLESHGDIVRGSSKIHQRISARAKLSTLEALAAMPEVRKVRERIPYITNKINTSEADQTHLAEVARALYNTTGAGVKIGVISDGVDSLTTIQASGDLPPVVEVLPGQAGAGDEGTAMLELVHDLAPGADLAFATCDPDEAQFAQNILDLAAAGCDIIVDDILYLAESPFQDGAIAQAVNTVTAAGVLYFSSAGNEGNATDLTSGTWEGDFNDGGLITDFEDMGNVHDFGDGGQSVLIEDAFFTPPLLIWAEHYDLNTGTASTDYDLYVMNGDLDEVLDGSTDVQDGTGGDDFPIEFVGGGAFTGERLVVAEFAAGTTSSAPMFNLLLIRGQIDDNVATGGATRGHSAAADSFSTAATPVAESFDGITPNGPYPDPFTSANESEGFSSDGPRRIILTPAGAEITPGNRTSTGGVVRQKPDITAADGASTATPGFETFYGTSAAAPHAAAIAALMLEAVPGITPAQVRTGLVSSAIDIEAPGVDATTGAGIIMADAALAAVGAEAGAFLEDGPAVPTQAAGDGDAFIESNEIYNFTIPLTNIGAEAATGISAVLSTSAPGVTINNANSAYPDIAVAGTQNNTTPFNVTFGPTVACGATVEFTLTVTYTGDASPQEFTFSVRVGEPGTPQTFSYVGPAVAIPDAGAPVTVNLNVAGVPGGIYDIEFRIDGSACNANEGSTTVGLDHSFVSDLDLLLRGPGGEEVLLAVEPDSSGNNFCQTVFDDDGGNPSITTQPSTNNPFTGTFTPFEPLSAFQTLSANGTWQFQAQDFAADDTGSIRAFAIIITPAICNAPPLAPNVSGTKTVSGTFSEGGLVTYTVTLNNTGAVAQADNAGDEFVDVLPADVTLVNASATSGTAVPNVGTNTVTWNGSIAAGGSVTITITALVDDVPDGTVISNQGTINYDSDADNDNDASNSTDDPGVGGAEDPTSFTVSGASVTATKTASPGPYMVGGNVTYTITLSNSGNVAAGDNPGNEFVDVLPSSLTLVSANASSGAASADLGTNTVTWNGSIPAAGSVTITISATIDAEAAGSTVTNQGQFSYDSNGDGTNDTNGVTDDPSAGGAADGTGIVVAGVALDTVTKTVSGSFTVGSNVTYTIVITNTGDSATGDNPGDELTDVLPPQLALVSATATSGTAIANTGTNTVTWNGSVASGASVTITITATINNVPPGTIVSNQATHMYDSDTDGVNDQTVLSNDPATTPPSDPTTFAVAANIAGIPTASTLGLMLLGICIALVAFRALRG